MDIDERLEELALTIIANSGATRSMMHQALSAAKEGAHANAMELIEQAEDKQYIAHAAHRELLKMEANGEISSMTLLLAHAQDHLMNSDLCKELIKEMIELYKIRVTAHRALKSRIMHQFFYSHRSCRRCFVKKCCTTRLFLPNQK